MLPDYFQFSLPTKVVYGPGALKGLKDLLAPYGARKAVLVTDKVLAASGPVDLVKEGLKGSEVAVAAVFDQVPPNSTLETVTRCAELIRAQKADMIIAVGGGSVMDTAKTANLLAVKGGRLQDHMGAYLLGPNEALLDFVAIPTTAGTGSEVGRASVITNSETHEKKIIFHPRILPSVVICDPELTVGMPRTITAGTGMDAFAHCLEAYSSPHYHPMSQGIALEGLRLVREYLPRAFEDGTDLEARANMMSAAAMGAVAFQKGLGAIHALSHPIGAHYNTHHGTTNAVVMQPVLRFNRPAIEDKIARAAAYLGISGGFDGFYNVVGALNDSLGIPRNLTALGVTDPDLDLLTKAALADPSTGGNPVPMTPQNTLKLFKECL